MFSNSERNVTSVPKLVPSLDMWRTLRIDRNSPRLVLAFLVIFGVLASGVAGQDVEGIYDGGQPAYNEQGLLSSSSSELARESAVSDYNGNLTYSKTLYHFEGEADFDLDITLTYNGSVAHDILPWHRQYIPPHKRSAPIRINAPEWILSVNGIAVQLFNFENELHSWFSSGQTGHPGTLNDRYLRRDSVALTVPGYHMNMVGSDGQYMRNELTYMLSDGSLVTVYDELASIGSGIGLGDGKNQLVKAWCELVSPNDKRYWIMPGNGTTIHGRNHSVKWKHGFQEPCDYFLDQAGDPGALEVGDTLGVFLADSIYDGRGNVITISYTHEGFDGVTILGRPLVNSITLNHDPNRRIDLVYDIELGSFDRRIQGVAIGDYEIELESRPTGPGGGTLPSLRGSENRGYITGITDPEGRVTQFEYERYVRHLYDLQRVALKGRTPTVPSNVCICDYLTPDEMSPDFFRLSEVRESSGGMTRYMYYGSVNGETDSLRTDATTAPHTNEIPRQFSPAFQAIGRDPFFTNLVTSIRRYDTENWPEELDLVSADSLEYSWIPFYKPDPQRYDYYDTLITDRYSDSVQNPKANGRKRHTQFMTYPCKIMEYPAFYYETSRKTQIIEQANAFDTARHMYDISACQHYNTNPAHDFYGCEGSLRRKESTISKAGEQYEIEYEWELASDSYNFSSEATIGPMGVKKEIEYDESWLDVDASSSLYMNSLVAAEKIIDTTTGELLSLVEYEYFATDCSDGYAGQLKRRIDQELVDGTSISTRVTEYQYYYDDAGQGPGNLRKIVAPSGDSTVLTYELPEGSSGGSEYNLTYNVVECDGTTSERHEQVDNYKSAFAIARQFVQKEGGYIDTLTQYRAYDRFGRPIRSIDELGNLSLTDYDDLGRPTLVAAPLSYEAVETLDDVIVRTDLSGHSTEFLYDDVAYDESYTHRTSVGRQALTDLVGGEYSYQELETRREYDGYGRNTQTDLVSGDETFDFVAGEFNFRGELEIGTDAAGEETTFEYDDIGRLIKTTYPDEFSSNTQKSYGTTTLDQLPMAVQQIVTMVSDFLSYVDATDENGNIARTYSDAVGQRRFIRATANSVDLWTAFDYDKLGHLTKIVKPEGDQVNYEYNSLGQLEKEWSSDYDTVFYRYDEIGRMILRRDGKQVHNQDPTYGSVWIDGILVTGSDGETKRDTILITMSGIVHYSLEVSTGSQDHSESKVYLNSNQQGFVHGIGCDENCGDGGGHCCVDGSFLVEAGDIVWVEVYKSVHGDEALASADYSAYTSAGSWTHSDYDNLGRVVATGAIDLVTLRNEPLDTLSITDYCRWFYDQGLSENSKRRLSLSYQGDSEYGQKFDYDARGRIAEKAVYFKAILDSADVLADAQTKYEHDLDASAADFSIQYEYNMADQITKVVYPDGDLQVLYDYDDRGRLIAVGEVGDADRYAALFYTKRNQVDSILLGNRVQRVDYDYNERGWLDSINGAIEDSGSVSDRFRQRLYYYDHPDNPSWGGQFNGNILAQELELNGSLAGPYHYEYDALDRLTRSTIGSDLDEFFYDMNGNRDSLRQGSTVRKYGYSNGNLLDTIGVGISQALQRYEYDGAGNAIRAWYWTKDLRMTYDLYGQMINVRDWVPDYNQVTYGYSAGGERVWKLYAHWEDPCSDTSGTEPLGSEMMGAMGGGGLPPLPCPQWISDTTYYVRGQNDRVLAEYAALGGQPTARYIYAGSQKIAMVDSLDNFYYYINDHLGSAGVLLAADGTVRDKYRYKPFGGMESGQSVNVGQSYRYTGKPIDEELDMDWYYYGARYYDPEIGRFLAVDPLASDYPSWGPYVYTLNNPLKHVDPTGLKPESDISIYREARFDQVPRFLGAMAGALVWEQEQGFRAGVSVAGVKVGIGLGYSEFYGICPDLSGSEFLGSNEHFGVGGSAKYGILTAKVGIQKIYRSSSGRLDQNLQLGIRIGNKRLPLGGKVGVLSDGDGTNSEFYAAPITPSNRIPIVGGTVGLGFHLYFDLDRFEDAWVELEDTESSASGSSNADPGGKTSDDDE